MKKGSGFEKFFKGKEKTGGAKKEAIRQEKREVRKEREEKIANAKRQKRAQYKSASNNEPPKYNLEPPTSRFQKKDTERKGKPAPSFKVEKKAGRSAPDHFNQQDRPKPFKKEGNSFEKKPNDRFEPREKRSENKGDRFKPTRDQRSNGPQEKRFSRPTEKRAPEKRENRFKDQRDDRLKRDMPLKPLPVDKRETTESLKPKLKTPAKPLTEQMPLNKYIAHSGICSRRDAVNLIKSGKVKVNGELILEPGHKVALTDDVKIAGKKLNPVKDFIYILLNKPKDYITTTEDPQERKTVLDLLKTAPPARIYPVGRLDRNTSGVLLLTNDGDLSQKLTHPSNEIKKVYAVTLDKPLTRHHFEEIIKGVPLEDGVAYVDTLAYTDASDLTQIGVELHTGRNRIVRRIFEHFGYDVKALDRVIFAGLTKKNVNRGKWRFLTEKEVRDLKFFKKGR
jgi:23S rRNA pseudouridine2605 synthase